MRRLVDRIMAVRCAALALAALLAGGCASIQPGFQAVPSHAFDAPTQSWKLALHYDAAASRYQIHWRAERAGGAVA